MVPPEVWGWLFEMGAWIGFGSFGVPMKWPSVLAAEVDPLVYQTWKSVMCFITSWLVLTYNKFEFTLWGIVSGIFWVPGGVLTIIGIQSAGLAAALGVLCCVAAITSLSVGILVFEEPVWSIPITIGAAFTLLCGLVGMIVVLKKSNNPEKDPEKEKKIKSVASINFDSTPLIQKPENLRCFGLNISKFWLGIICAFGAGICAGLNLAPAKFAAKYSGFSGGIEYLISYSVGTITINTVMWVGYILIRLSQGKPALPNLHFRLLIVPGTLSGILWSAGNFCALNAIEILGVGIGNSSVQAQIIVSGLWGIFFYREIHGLKILLWLFFALVGLTGIVGLSLMQYFGSLEHNHNSTVSF